MLPSLKVVNSNMVVTGVSLDWVMNGGGKCKVTGLS